MLFRSLVGAVADANSEDGTDAGGVGAGEDSGEFVRGVHVEMGVRVDEGHGLGTRYEVRGSRFEVRGSRFEVRGSREGGCCRGLGGCSAPGYIHAI